MKLPQWLQRKRAATSAQKTKKLLLMVKKKTSGLYMYSVQHWRAVKWVAVLLAAVVGFFGYQFYQRVNKEAFESSVDVVPTGVEDINTTELLGVITAERQRSEQFGVLVADPVVSFDPAQYGVELRRASEVASSTDAGQGDQSE